MFPSYVENPQDLRFEGQDSSEQILLLLRAHPITNLKWIIPAIVLFFLPFFIETVLAMFSVPSNIVPESFALVLLLFNFLLIMVISFEGFLYWYFNVYIVTNKNIIDVDFHSILYKNIDVAPLRNIEDTSSSMGGILSSIFHFGNVFIQTAGAAKNIDLLDVPRPHHVADYILDETHKIHNTHKGGHPGGNIQ